MPFGVTLRNKYKNKNYFVKTAQITEQSACPIVTREMLSVIWAKRLCVRMVACSIVCRV